MPEQQSAAPGPAAGPWAARIRIDDSPARPTVRGTRFEDVRLREVLRGNGFRWRRVRELWEYTGPAGGRGAAVRAVREVVAELDRAESAPDTGEPKRSHPPTAQQQAIIDAAVTQKLDVAVQALAGTGKTSTLNMVARRVAEASPQTRIVYIAFNASIAKEARETFGPNVTSLTAHALALRSLRTGAHAGKTTRIGRGVRHPGDIADLLKLEAVAYRDHDGEPQELAPSVRAQLAMAVVRTFRESADLQITEAHLPDALTAFPGTDRAVLDTARQIWDDIADPSNAHLLEGDRPRAVLFDHDDHLKLWALSQPRIDAGLIFFDEAQDINAVLRRLVQDQPTQTIVVGDTFQSIYGFRGAEDALADWPADVTLPLTRSWRLGRGFMAAGWWCGWVGCGGGLRPVRVGGRRCCGIRG
ncbi:AAA family ATPase [Actinomadura formosensis]|uniref:AAA family ATPase n=1 Tax=Actinomadura formosensis TaxID=60706 RepID=UPI00083209C3|nr:UvrD-helicase domain-containing protein [Actinomadura formosensis]